MLVSKAEALLIPLSNGRPMALYLPPAAGASGSKTGAAADIAGGAAGEAFALGIANTAKCAESEEQGHSQDSAEYPSHWGFLPYDRPRTSGCGRRPSVRVSMRRLRLYNPPKSSVKRQQAE